MDVADKSILITGASSGIGLATAQLLAVHGARVALAARNEVALAEAVAELGRPARRPSRSPATSPRTKTSTR
jgi:NAD(P)-dependent dehydrogenase (short-subunit alcohol dehydrogenase family)